jgi:zinc/manganese transport system substrate-binding protein
MSVCVPLSHSMVIFQGRFMKSFLARFSVVVALFSVYGWPSSAGAVEKLPVVASFSILGDLVSIVGGDRVTVTTLVAADSDAHIFEPKPADVKRIAQAKLLVVNGLGFEPWAAKLAQSADYKGQTVVASQGIQPLSTTQDGKKSTDPHAWQNPRNVITYVRNIAAALSKLDPAGAVQFQGHSEAYVKELEALDTWATAQFAALPQAKRKVITSHDAFGYFAAQYQITFFAPQGMSTETEPSAKQVAHLIRQIKVEKIKAVFVENMTNPKLLAQLAKDAGVVPGPALYADALSSADKPAASYLQMMRHNITQLAAGMRLN